MISNKKTNNTYIYIWNCEIVDFNSYSISLYFCCMMEQVCFFLLQFSLGKRQHINNWNYRWNPKTTHKNNTTVWISKVSRIAELWWKCLHMMITCMTACLLCQLCSCSFWSILIIHWKFKERSRIFRFLQMLKMTDLLQYTYKSYLNSDILAI